LTSIVPFVALIGALIGGPLAKLGRKIALIITDLFSIIGVVTCVCGLHFKAIHLFFIGRIICGINVGINSTLVPLYIKEISPVKMSG
jgi:MFS family permease